MVDSSLEDDEYGSGGAPMSKLERGCPILNDAMVATVTGAARFEQRWNPPPPLLSFFFTFSDG